MLYFTLDLNRKLSLFDILQLIYSYRVWLHKRFTSIEDKKELLQHLQPLKDEDKAAQFHTLAEKLLAAKRALFPLPSRPFIYVQGGNTRCAARKRKSSDNQGERRGKRAASGKSDDRALVSPVQSFGSNQVLSQSSKTPSTSQLDGQSVIAIDTAQLGRFLLYLCLVQR